jgi:hypothetical protein
MIKIGYANQLIALNNALASNNQSNSNHQALSDMELFKIYKE